MVSCVCSRTVERASAYFDVSSLGGEPIFRVRNRDKNRDSIFVSRNTPFTNMQYALELHSILAGDGLVDQVDKTRSAEGDTFGRYSLPVIL